MSNRMNEKEVKSTQDDEALIILWQMMNEEGYQNSLKNVDAYSVQYMLKSHKSFSSLLDFGDVVMLNGDKKGQ